MSLPHDTDLFVPCEEELSVLWDGWEKGNYRHHVANLLGFVEEKTDTLRQVVKASEGPVGCVAAVRAFLIDLGTVHPVSEMRDQMRAIHDEIWYCGERGEHDRARIVDNWTKLHAASWRRWRLMEYLFVLERQADEVVAIVCPHAL